MVPKFFDAPTPVPYTILNACYFKGTWTKLFDKEDTAPGIFHSANGDQTVDMMSRQSGFELGFLDGYTEVVRLQYGNGAFRMTILLPQYQDLKSFARQFDIERWNSLKNFSDCPNIIFMPKFKLSYRQNIIKYIRPILPGLLAEDKEFENIANTPMKANFIGHLANVEVSEEGTEVAAVTGFGWATSSGDENEDASIRINRPFMFVIDEVSTGAILFIGTVNTIEQ